MNSNISNLVCPYCHEQIHYEENIIKCLSCDNEYPQKKGYLELLPGNKIGENDTDWQVRQEEMENWYRDLLKDRETARSVFKHDYSTFSKYFKELSGNILDLGGGIGIIRHYLSKENNYVVVDPSLDWINMDWKVLSDSYPCLNERLNYILGVGEYLMFEDNTFDVVLSLWSINHVNDPNKVFQEINRVLKSKGRLFIILEDMEPKWVDFFSKSFFKQFRIIRYLTLVKHKIIKNLSFKKWPIQADHIEINERDLQKWLKSQFHKSKREWKGRYLTYEFIKK